MKFWHIFILFGVYDLYYWIIYRFFEHTRSSGSLIYSGSINILIAILIILISSWIEESKPKPFKRKIIRRTSSASIVRRERRQSKQPTDGGKKQ